MTSADTSHTKLPQRLDSWKEIAEYLRRDVRTCHRWEAQGLPVHRVKDGKGRAVFAFPREIEAWLSGKSADAAASPPHQCPALQQPCPLPAGCPARQHCMALALPCGAAAVRASRSSGAAPQGR